MDYELAYRYGAPSRLDEGAGLALATSGGSTPEGEAAHPYFFSGFMERPDVVAAGLLAVARVARTRFYVPPGMVVAPGGGLTRIGMLDPVVTSTAEGLRFESFSVCCGVYARLDVEALALDATHCAVGVTNVDVNQPLRAALASLRAGEPLHLGVGEEGLTATTLDEEVTEEKVPLSLRWLKGFAETQMLSSAMMPLHVLNTAQARAFIRGLPRSSATGTVMWAGRAVRGLRLGTRPAPGAACVAGPERLRVFEPLLHLITSLEAYGPDVDAGSEPVASLWVARLPGARLSVGLSPAKSRGFSGEGAVLASLGDPRVEEDADMLSALLSFEPRIDTDWPPTGWLAAWHSWPRVVRLASTSPRAPTFTVLCPCVPTPSPLCIRAWQGRARLLSAARSHTRRGRASVSPRAQTATGWRCPPTPTPSASIAAPAQGG